MQDDIQPLTEACPACGTLIDVSEIQPLSEIGCPSCSAAFTARRQFNNFTLLEKIGQGGMGTVYKAIDSNLNREVALKILRREISGDAEEREKLAQEARRTATINHPHVVQVFNFGEDRGQFYIAMELVGKGSLDDLMGLQKRVAEMQILTVGIQIASGLQAALEAGLIHRDIKPGNILFADARTAKLVDFGLALIADEAAAQRGEIWGTPYYIAPEKLDQQPEDFRSDIYSLGGTLFHALAGRPPYEAETASMVALKQLKSQAVSLQAFAPDVSAETAYVINKMMNKNPDERYQSYAELIEHLTFAKDKLLQRVAVPTPAKREVLQVESAEGQKLVGIFTLGLAIILLLLIAAGFWHWDRIATVMGLKSAADIQMEAERNGRDILARARSDAASGKIKEASGLVESMLKQSAMAQPAKNWALLHAALFAYAGDNPASGNPFLQQIESAGILPPEIMPIELSNFFVGAARRCIEGPTINIQTARLYDPANHEAFAYYLFGFRNLGGGNWKDAKTLLEAAVKNNPAGDADWINSLRPLAESRLGKLAELAALASAPSAAEARAALETLRSKRDGFLFSPAMKSPLEKLEKDLLERASRP